MPKKAIKYSIDFEIAEMVTLERLLEDKIIEIRSRRHDKDNIEAVIARINYYNDLLKKVRDRKEKIVESLNIKGRNYQRKTPVKK